MDHFIEIVGEESIKLAVVAVAGLLYGVVRAWAAVLVRRADQQWKDHGDDDDDEIKVHRVTDQVQADSAWMSVLPRGVVERQVRKSKDSELPPQPDEPPPN